MNEIQFYYTLALGASLFCMGWLLTAGNWASRNSSKKAFKTPEEAALITGRWGRRAGRGAGGGGAVVGAGE